MIIGITGTFAAGKGTVVEFLKEKGFRHYSVRDFLTEEVKRRGLEVSQGNFASVANDLRTKFGASYIVEEMYRRASEKAGDVVIESVRCPGEVEALKKKGEGGADKASSFVLWAVDADPEVRYARIIERKGSAQDEKNFTFQKFMEREQAQMDNTDPNLQNLGVCIEMADHVFRNDWTIGELKGKVEKEVEKVLGGSNTPKRENVLSWDDYFMSIAFLSAQRSKDPSTQVGSCIVDSDKKIIGVGYNGFPTGCDDDDLPWAREGDFLNVKYPYVCHSELNAILNSGGRDLKGASIYVALFPCNQCAKAIIQSGIKEVVYLSDKYAELDITKAAKKMFEMSGVRTRQMIPKTKSVLVSLDVE